MTSRMILAALALSGCDFTRPNELYNPAVVEILPAPWSEVERDRPQILDEIDASEFSNVEEPDFGVGGLTLADAAPEPDAYQDEDIDVLGPVDPQTEPGCTLVTTQIMVVTESGWVIAFTADPVGAATFTVTYNQGAEFQDELSIDRIRENGRVDWKGDYTWVAVSPLMSTTGGTAREVQVFNRDERWSEEWNEFTRFYLHDLDDCAECDPVFEISFDEGTTFERPASSEWTDTNHCGGV